MTTIEQKIYQFGLKCIEKSQFDGGGDIDGEWAHDTMIDLGIIRQECNCAAWDKFPQPCLRYTPEVLEELKRAQTTNEVIYE